jgi:ATPase subunit of ABC transporter with duplicated ATPase domains
LLAARGVNCLILDEPTNHLDVPAIEELERTLDAFDGTVLLVTHDRRFLGSFRATQTLQL